MCRFQIRGTINRGEKAQAWGASLGRHQCSGWLRLRAMPEGGMITDKRGRIVNPLTGDGTINKNYMRLKNDRERRAQKALQVHISVQ